MTYKFECKECQNEEEKNIPVEKYDEEKHKQICSKCNGSMFRIIEFSDAVGLCSGMYGTSGSGSWNN